MKKSAFISDILFTFLAILLFTLCLFRYMGISFSLSVVLSVVCGGLAGLSFGAFMKSKRNAYFLKKADEQQKQKLLLHLALSSDERVTKLFQSAYEKTAEVLRIGRKRLTTENELVFFNFAFSAVDADEIATIARVRTKKQKILFCNELKEDAERLCQRLNIQTRTANEAYAFLKQADALPNEYLGEEQPQNKKLRRKKICFAKHNARRFLISGALVLATSLFTPFPYYYLIFGSILLAVALLIRILGYV